MKFLFWFFNKYPLHIAVENGNIEIIKLLLEKKDININVKDNQVTLDSYGLFIYNYGKRQLN